MARDKRWPAACTSILFIFHIMVCFALFGLSTTRLSKNSTTFVLWMVPESIICAIATMIFLIISWRAALSPGWTLSWFLLTTLLWTALIGLFTINESASYSYGCFGTDLNYYTPYQHTCFVNLLDICALVLLGACWLSSLAIFIFTTVVVHRWRRENRKQKILEMVAASQSSRDIVPRNSLPPINSSQYSPYSEDGSRQQYVYDELNQVFVPVLKTGRTTPPLAPQTEILRKPVQSAQVPRFPPKLPPRPLEVPKERVLEMDLSPKYYNMIEQKSLRNMDGTGLV